MTLQQFLDSLSQYNWELTETGLIRSYVGYHYGWTIYCCPLTRAKSRHACEYRDCAPDFDFGPELVEEIANAADAIGSYNTTLRNRLLVACNLSSRGDKESE